MTTAHRPTFDPARGKEALRGPAYHQRLLPAYTQLKFRQAGQGGDADASTRDLRAELEAAEAAHYAKLKGAPIPGASDDDNNNTADSSTTNKRPLAALTSTKHSADADADEDEDPDAKRRRILAESRAIDADDDDSDAASGSGDNDDADDSDDDSSDDDDDAELQRELDRVRRERVEKREAEERARLAAEQEDRERDIALGNPLLNNASASASGGAGAAGGKAADFSIKRRWDDDVVFKNQARGTEEKGKRAEFINDLLRSDFHKRFMSKYVR